LTIRKPATSTVTGHQVQDGEVREMVLAWMTTPAFLGRQKEEAVKILPLSLFSIFMPFQYAFNAQSNLLI